MGDVFGRLRVYTRNGLRTVLDAVLFILSFLVPKRDGLWCFGSHYPFEGNSKYLYLRVANDVDGVDPVWVTDDNDVRERLEDSGYDAVHQNSLGGIVTLLRSECTFVTHTMHDVGHWSTVWFRTRAVNLTHGTPMMGPSTDSLNRKQRMVTNASDFLVVTSKRAAEAFRAARLAPTTETVLATGYPRNDALFIEFDDAVHSEGERLREELPDVNGDTNLVVYLPTKRGYRTQNPLLDDESTLAEFDAALESINAHLVVKRHPAEPTPSVDAETQNVTVLDSSLDVHPLLTHADLLITDYSSVYLPYLLLDRPVVFFPYDFERFAESRSLLYDYDDITPGPKAYGPHSLLEAVTANIDGTDGFREDRERVRNLYHRYHDGKASERLATAFREGNFESYVV